MLLSKTILAGKKIARALGMCSITHLSLLVTLEKRSPGKQHPKPGQHWSLAASSCIVQGGVAKSGFVPVGSMHKCLSTGMAEERGLAQIS